MVYTLPTFNLSCNIWHMAQPLNVNAPYIAPVGAPSVTCQCQLYISPRNTGTIGEYWYKTMSGPGHWSDSGPGTQVRLPALTDVRYSMPNSGSYLTDVIECPAGSGRFYVVLSVEDRHKGFINEYRVANVALYLLTVGWPLP